MSTQILNLTPHEINIGTASIKPFGVVARVYVESISDGEFTTASGVTIPISHSYYGDVENLPNPMPNTIYIVSALVASRVPTRSDVFTPAAWSAIPKAASSAAKPSAVPLPPSSPLCINLRCKTIQERRLNHGL